MALDVEKWDRIIASMRHQIAKQVPMMEAMKPDEMEKFIESARSLQALEREIATQEAEIDKRLRRAELIFDGTLYLTNPMPGTLYNRVTGQPATGFSF